MKLGKQIEEILTIYAPIYGGKAGKGAEAKKQIKSLIHSEMKRCLGRDKMIIPDDNYDDTNIHSKGYNQRAKDTLRRMNEKSI